MCLKKGILLMICCTLVILGVGEIYDTAQDVESEFMERIKVVESFSLVAQNKSGLLESDL